MKGLLIVLSGPSGVGKGTVSKVLMQDKSLNIAFSISMTTRAPRNGEVDGREYFFVSDETFEENIKNGELLEHAQFVGHKYGTPKSYVEKMRNDGKNVLLEIETNGARQVMEKYSNDPKFVSIFLLPPSESELEARIRGRQTESEQVIQERLEKSKKELKLSNLYMYQVVNKIAEDAANEISAIIKSRINN